ncbi:hypothetical protein [Amycolatopsis orientalis]|uniref:hypothetical protein n=1 Tax=Amycolatopsis orientalis TaxID=31958 RepID=UPI0011AB3388|nr:hypothetical protein [Amycolatopsis orientalis]
MTETSAWLAGMNFWVTDDLVDVNVNRARGRESWANAQVQQAAHGPGFQLDRDHAEKMVKDATEVLRRLRNDQSITESLERMKSAADDPVSVGFTKAATWSGGQPGAFAYGAGHVRLEILYLEELVRRLNTALGRTAGNEQDARNALQGVEEGAN